MRLLCLLFFLTSCAGYHLDMPPSIAIQVPFAQNDPSGEFTQHVIYALNTTGFQTTHYLSRLCLRLRLIDTKETHVGYRFDRDGSGQRNRTMVPTETRLSLLIEAEIIDTYTQKTVLGPAYLSTFEDFDHDWYSSFNGLNVFSLGQITDYSEAKQQVLNPLYQSLAQKIAHWAYTIHH